MSATTVARLVELRAATVDSHGAAAIVYRDAVGKAPRAVVVGHLALVAARLLGFAVHIAVRGA